MILGTHCVYLQGEDRVLVLETNTQEQLIFKHSVSNLLVCCKNKRCTETCQTGLGVPKAAD